MKDTQDSTQTNLAHTIVQHARSYLGHPYHNNPLIGDHKTREQFVAAHDAFDCVTFIECVLAECFSKARHTPFDDELCALRYRNGQISWDSRLHYFSDWLKTNAARGALYEVFVDLPATTRILSLLEHYPPITATLHFLPPKEIHVRRSSLASGDIVAFGTTRENLDVTHTGFLDILPDQTILLIHATKSVGKVIEEPLDAFLTRFGDSPGLLLYRPTVPTQ